MIGSTADVPAIEVFENGIFSSNTYFCRIPQSDSCIIVDPGLDFEGLEGFLAERNLKPAAIFCTHGHFDHVGSAGKLKAKHNIPVYVPAADKKLVSSANFLLMACKINARIQIPEVDVWMDETFSTEVGGLDVNILAVPGHTLGSSFVRIGNAVFTGDSLYKNAVGLVNFPGEKPKVLRESLLRIWDMVPDTSRIYPGHGGSGVFGEIKQNNKRLRTFLGLDPSPASFEKSARASGDENLRKFKEEL